MGPNPTTRTDREAEQRGAEADGELGDVDVLLACRKEVTALVHCPTPTKPLSATTSAKLTLTQWSITRYPPYGFRVQKERRCLLVGIQVATRYQCLRLAMDDGTDLLG